METKLGKKLLKVSSHLDKALWKVNDMIGAYKDDKTTIEYMTLVTIEKEITQAKRLLIK